MSKAPWTAVWAAIVVVGGLGVAYVTRPAQAPSPVPLNIGEDGEVAERQESRTQTQKPAAEKKQDEFVDPIVRLVDPYLALVDKHWNEWDLDKDGALSWVEFVSGLDGLLKLPVALASLLPDLSGDGVVTREEARGTIEFLLGVQMLGSQPVRLPGPARPGVAVLPPGWEFASVPLRSSSAHVLNLIHFRQLDQNRSGALDERELGNLGVAGLDLSTVLAACDADKDGQVALVEWWKVPIAGAADTIAEFQAVDANQDGYLDRQELRNVPSYKLKVARHVLPAFDFDGDGKLSLGEYRFTPLANPLVDWNRDIVDADGSLTFAEYLDRSEPFVLLYWNYFQKFDLNSDGLLDLDEYRFRARTPEAVYGMNADGTGWAKLFQLPGYPVCGSVAVSPDGRKIACDAWQVASGGPSGMPTIFVADIDGQNIRKLCRGQMPSWSSDGKFFVCSRVEGESGVWIMTSDGEEHRRVGDGWSGQWSPDGKKIAYYEGHRLLVYDVETQESRDVLDEAHAYRQIFWNMCWSPDSRQICFRGIRMEGREELVLVDAAGAERGMKVRFGGEPFSSKFAWHPTASRLVFSKPCPERGIMQLYELDPKTDDPPVLLAGQDPHTHNEDPAWTPDGRRLILVRGNY
ncbi:MAG TPA: hypothetical protein VG125_25595 [Pirellulales bacterium]|nr:hypothetical protein [Pirellulales bacterium]